MQKIYVIHENNDWVVPLRKAFAERDLPYAEWYLDQWAVDLSGVPPHGVFYNRMSASSHSRDHRYSPELAATVLAWLGRHGRVIVNDTRARNLSALRLPARQSSVSALRFIAAEPTMVWQTT